MSGFRDPAFRGNFAEQFVLVHIRAAHRSSLFLGGIANILPDSDLLVDRFFFNGQPPRPDEALSPLRDGHDHKKYSY